MSDNQNIDTTKDPVEATQTPETNQDQANNGAPKESPKDLRETIESNYKTKMAEIEAKAKADSERVAKLQAEIEAKNKTVEELLEEAKTRQLKSEEEIQRIKKSADIERSLLTSGVNPELHDLIKGEALNLYQDQDVSEVVNALKTKYPTAFTVGKPVNIGVSAPNASSNQITKEKAMEMVKNPTLYKQHREEINRALRS